MDYRLEYLGGAQAALRQQAAALLAAGHAVTVIAPDAPADAALAAVGATLRRAASWGAVPGVALPIVVNGARTRRVLARLMDDERIDLVVVHSELGLAAAAIEVARARRTPTMHVVHTFFWRAPRIAAPLAPVVTALHAALTGLRGAAPRTADRLLDSALRGMTWRACMAADLVVSPSRHQAAALGAAGVEHVTVIGNAVGAMPSARRPRTDELRLVWAGRFAPEKRLDVALEAMRLVDAALGPGRVRLDVAGGRLPRRARSASVVAHGRVAPHEVAALLGRADAAVITSCGFDNQPMVALEAFRAGRPIIVSDPVLAAEFRPAAIAAETATASGLAATILGLVADRSALLDAALGAAALASEASPAVHVDRLLAAHDRLAARSRVAPSGRAWID
ncbi:glycosyltransferase involved in cell wall biosynthesis [Agrococcus sp. UYP10]|uniref:glycosyltransferase n=1 Tax=Agrococcus sp. UYP10 TaxID=1756355 RepID=UPI003393EFA5